MNSDTSPQAYRFAPSAAGHEVVYRDHEAIIVRELTAHPDRIREPAQLFIELLYEPDQRRAIT